MLVWNKHYIKSIHGIKLQKNKIKHIFWTSFSFSLCRTSRNPDSFLSVTLHFLLWNHSLSYSVTHTSPWELTILAFIYLCWFRNHLVFNRVVLLLCWEICSGQLPWTPSNFTTGTHLHRQDLEVSKSYFCFIIVLLSLPKEGVGRGWFVLG